MVYSSLENDTEGLVLIECRSLIVVEVFTFFSRVGNESTFSIS